MAENLSANAGKTSGSQHATLGDLLVKTVSGTWPKIVILVFFSELVFLFLGSTISIPQSLVQQINGSNSALGHTSQSLDLLSRAGFIFSNNFKIAIIEFVPLGGWFFFGLSMYSTALAIEVIGIVSIPSLPGPLVMLSLLLEPHSWLELPAYAIATTQSFYLISTAIQRRRFKFEVARTGLVIGVVAADLLIAALFESAEISLSPSGLVGLLVIPWTLFAFLAVLVILGRRSVLRKYRSELVGQPPIMPPAWPQQLSGQTSYARFCGKCGAKVQNPATSVFCEQCGQRLLQPGVGSYSPKAVGSANPPPPIS